MMSSPKVLYSLPKTQSTLSSSSKMRIKTHEKISYQYLQTSPQISAFTPDNKQQLYTHNMVIDYGRLQKPYHEQLKKSIKKEIDLSQDLGLLLSTKKFKNLKQYTINDTSLNQTQNQGIQPPIHGLLTQKKAFSTQKYMKTVNPQSGDKLASSKQKKKNRIMSVKAYETSNNSIVSLAEQNKLRFTGMKLGNGRQIKQKMVEQDWLRSERSDKKISHSRIIKTFNPTAGIQTKIITYPDLSQVFKTRDSRRKVN